MTQPETFWLTVEVQVQTIFILIGVILFWSIPRAGRQDFFELGLLLMISFVVESIGSIGIHILKKNMNLGMNIFDIVYLPLIILLYRRKVNWDSKDGTAKVVIPLFLCFAMINLFFIQGPFNFNGYTTSLASVICIVLSLGYFYLLIQQLPTESISKLPMFWVNTALLIYHSGTFFFFLSTDYLVRVLNNNLITFWMFHHSFGMMHAIMLGYALILARKEHLAKSSVVKVPG